MSTIVRAEPQSDRAPLDGHDDGPSGTCRRCGALIRDELRSFASEEGAAAS